MTVQAVPGIFADSRCRSFCKETPSQKFSAAPIILPVSRDQFVSATQNVR